MDKPHFIRMLTVNGLCCLLMMICACDCYYPEIKVRHSPIVATSGEQVTFTVTVLEAGEQPSKVELLVNAALVQTFNNVQSDQTYTFTGGPYAAYQGTTVSYLAKITANNGKTDTRGYYYFAITDNNYNWANTNIPARYVGAHTQKEDIAFHRTNEYTSFKDFVDDVDDKVWDVYDQQDIINAPDNLDNFNFYIYTKIATTTDCGTVHSDCDTDMPWRDVDAVLHVANMTDCTNLEGRHFTAEGSNTKAFLHESGHAVFGLADEYDGNTHYFEPVDEPNIWDLQATGKTEQTAKGRDPNAVWKFTAKQGDWWGIQLSTANNVMQVGNVGDPWGTEGTERMNWYFNQF